MDVAAVQLPAKNAPNENLDRAVSRIRDAADAGAELVVLPELWPVGYFAFDGYDDATESVPGETTDRLGVLADDLSIYLHGGSVLEREGDGLYNTSPFFGPDGDLLATYRKMHLFGYESEEARRLTPGSDACAVETEFGTVGLTTCYDLRFPALYRSLVDKGVEMLLVTSAWPLERLDHWHLFARTRAIESQSILVAANLAGSIEGVDLAGESVVIDSWGVERANAGRAPGTARAEIDLDAVRDARATFPVLEDRQL
ncbi:MAG: carbon-nitrogen family hydrolase [Halobellus sp.]|uniref:carbon-nitrogen family hydrolase n=1 Tax=Halobellus sp. TaxID=1979212 RepID=UPI0035D4AD60